MRRVLNFSCEGALCAATLDEAVGTTGLLIVSGGNEIRIGAHRGMVKLAADIAKMGHPVFRFDRRGIGDSEGENGEFTSSAADLAAALTSFRDACPHLQRIVAFGNCDAASALALHPPEGLDALVLANIWVIEPQDDLPPPAAIKARYLEKMKDPKAWLGLLTGAVNFRKLAAGLFKIAKPHAPACLPQQIADGVMRFAGPIHIILAERDNVALAFIDEWQKPAFAPVQARKNLSIERIDSASHSFAGAHDYSLLLEALKRALA